MNSPPRPALHDLEQTLTDPLRSGLRPPTPTLESFLPARDAGRRHKQRQSVQKRLLSLDMGSAVSSLVDTDNDIGA